MALEFKWPIIIVFNELGPEMAFFFLFSFFLETSSEDPIFLYLAGVEYSQR